MAALLRRPLSTASWPKTLDTIYGGVDVMCKAVAEATDNKFQI